MVEIIVSVRAPHARIRIALALLRVIVASRIPLSARWEDRIGDAVRDWVVRGVKVKAD